MSERLTYWKCAECQGTGRAFYPWYAEQSSECFKCGGTGNALINGETERHKRRLRDERPQGAS